MISQTKKEMKKSRETILEGKDREENGQTETCIDDGGSAAMAASVRRTHKASILSSRVEISSASAIRSSDMPIDRATCKP